MRRPVLAAFLAAIFAIAPVPRSHAQEGPANDGSGYLPSSWDLSTRNRTTVGVTVLLTDDTTMKQDPFADLLVGLLLARRWGRFEIASLLTAGTNWGSGLEHVRLYASVTPRVAFPIGTFELTYGMGVATELRLTDDYWLLQVTASEIGLTFDDGGSFRFSVLGSLRLLVFGDVFESIVADARGVPPGASQEALDTLRESPLGWTLGVAFGRAL